MKTRKRIYSLVMAFAVLFTTILGNTGLVQAVETGGAAVCAQAVSSIQDGDVVVLYFENGTSDGLVLGTEASGKKLAGVTAVPSEGSLTVPEGAAKLEVSVDTDGYYSFLCDGKYLTSGETGSSLTYADAASAYSLWTIASTDGGAQLINVNAKYSEKNQYLEYFNGFTTYSYKESSSSVYNFSFYQISAGAEGSKVDTATTLTAAQWAGNADYEAAGITTKAPGDRFETNDMLDSSVEYTTVVSGAEKVPYTKTTAGTGGTTFYLGGAGLGSGTDDYIQMKISSIGYANMKMSFRLRASNTAPGSFQMQCSTDGTNFTNMTNGTYAYAYTKYVSGVPSEVSDSGAITNGIAKTSLAPTYYVTFTFDLPAAMENAENLYIRMVPGTDAAKEGGQIKDGGVIRIDTVAVTGNPLIANDICGYVKANPSSGTVSIGDQLMLSSSTAGAKIYYSLNGAEPQLYDETAKPVFSELPATLLAYATKEGIHDSVKTTYTYTQAQCASVKGTPNGGAVSENSKVLLSCDTKEATILYAYAKEGVADSDLDWKTYSSAIVLSELPTTIKVKARKDGYLDSAVSTLAFTKKENENYNIYFGQVHAHTNFSDGTGSVEDAFTYASKVANLDFLAVTDHSNSLDNESKSVLSQNVDTNATDEWTLGHSLAEQYSTSDFTCMYGFEMTWSNGLGHMNTFNSAGFQSRTQTAYKTYSTALQNYYATLQTAPDSISQFNHPGTTFGDFNDFAYYSEANDELIKMIEVGNGEGTIGSSGYFPSYEYYTRALDKGWHVAPTNNQDNHKGKWGDANTARTVVLADSNTQANIYDAMRNYRIYATEDNNLSIYYTLDNNIMGSSLTQDQVGNTVTIQAQISDADSADKIGKVEVITNGGQSIASQNVATNAKDVTFEVPSNYSYYYLKVTEADGDIAVTAPVWVGEVEACGINKTYTNTALPVQNENVDVNVDFYNNETSPLEIDSIEFSVDDKSVKNVTAAELQAANIASIASNSSGTYTYNYLGNQVGAVAVNITVNAKLDGVSKVYKDVLKLSYTSPEMVTNVIVDGTHYNDYVTGYYGGNLNSFVKICAESNIRVTIEQEKITEDELKDCALLIVSAPAKKAGTATAGDYTASHFEDSFIDMVGNYVKNGGSLITCGLADYQDTEDVQGSKELNKLLAAAGSTMTINSDEVYDTENNGGQAYRLYYANLNKDSRYLDGIMEGQVYSAYSGCSINITQAKETEEVYAADALVNGFDTTYSIDCKDEDGKSVSGQPTFVEKGKIVGLAHQATKAGGNIFAAGGVFMSDFEVDAEKDNNDSLPYANYNIIRNIVNEVKKTIPTSTIAEARKGNLGDIFAVEGYVTSGTTNADTTFFDTIYIQDNTAGIDIFPYAESGLAIGTKVRVVGTVDEYQGDRELRVISTEILKAEANIIPATELSTKDAMDYANYGGSLIKTTGKVTRVEYTDDAQGVAEFWIVDATGKEAAIFIDGYISSGTTGKNALASIVKTGATISAIGILYNHPEGESEEPVPVLRVRNCDDIVTAQVSNGGNNNNGSNSGNNNSQNNTPSVPQEIVVSVSDKAAVVEAIKKAETINIPSVKIEMGYSNVLNSEILQEAAGKNVNLVIDMGDYTWTISGKDIDASKIKDINLEVKIGAANIPVSVVKDVAGTRQTLQLSLTHDGELGFTGTLNIKVNADNAGKYGNLYYYNSQGKLEYMSTAKIQDDGSVNLIFTHASDYVLVIGESMAPNTGDLNIAWMILMLLAGCILLAGAYAARKRQL